MNPFADINIFAVLAATIVSMAIGFVWYHPALFGGKWMKLVGITAKEAEQGAGQAIGTGFVATLINTYFLAVLLAIAKPTSLTDTFVFGIIVWLAGAFPVALHRVAWEKKSWDLLQINAGYFFFGIMVTLAILYTWPW